MLVLYGGRGWGGGLKSLSRRHPCPFTIRKRCYHSHRINPFPSAPQVSTDPTQVADLSEGGAEEQDVTFTYSVTWKSSLLSFDKRMDKYRKYQFLKQHLEVRGWWALVMGLRCGCGGVGWRAIVLTLGQRA